MMPSTWAQAYACMHDNKLHKAVYLYRWWWRSWGGGGGGRGRGVSCKGPLDGTAQRMAVFVFEFFTALKLVDCEEWRRVS